MMRSSWLTTVATCAALCATACDGTSSERGSANAIGGAGAAGEGGATTGEGGTATTGEGGAAAEGALCSSVEEPNAWCAWAMPNPVHSGLPNPASYTPSATGNQVTDDVTGLIWQRNPDSDLFTWDEAQRHCACATIDGDVGWRLPSRIELASLVDWTTVSPSIDSSAFPTTASENYWTASLVTGDPGLGYLVFFENGHTTYSELGYQYRARCVRGSATANSNRYTVADGSVYDTQTKLTWQQTISTATFAWGDATAYCASLALGGAVWRVPTIGELQTIVDEATNPSIDAIAFPMTPSEYFWSSSAVSDDASRAWTAFFTNGSTYSFAVTVPKNVRCVH